MTYLAIHYYPVDWPALAQEIKELNSWCCQACQRQCRRPGELWLGWEYELTIAHYDHIYDAPEIFAVPMCVPCHFRHDSPYSWLARRQVREWRQRKAGQLALSLP
jgi:hypothetical protein